MTPSGVINVTICALILGGCSTATLTEVPTLPNIPEYVKIPHPAGYELSDLRALFFSPLAPQGVQGEFADTCDDEFKKLTEVTKSRDDLKLGATELVTNDPERMHWCFYSKLNKLQMVLNSDATWSTRQKKVLETYKFIGPISVAFTDVYHDSRYARWASTYYSKISEWVFFKKVAPSEDATLFMVNHSNQNPEPWTQLKNKDASASVFKKYGISFTPTLSQEKTETRAPASAPEPDPKENENGTSSDLVPENAIPELPVN